MNRFECKVYMKLNFFTISLFSPLKVHLTIATYYFFYVLSAPKVVSCQNQGDKWQNIKQKSIRIDQIFDVILCAC